MNNIIVFCLFASEFFVLSIAYERKNSIEWPVIGIDLGTSYSCVGIYKNGRVEIIPNELGNRITPSVVAFTDEERLIGEDARNQAAINPTRTLYDVKRLIGRKYTDKTVQFDKKFLPYDIFDKDSKPYVRVKNIRGIKNTIFSAEEISAMVIAKMKEISETYLGREIFNAVVTVPSNFNNAQRQATKDAVTISGLNVFNILNEATAAGIAYGFDKKFSKKKILVFDLGGGSLDVSILRIDNGVFEVIGTSGDTHLGGEDFDQKVIDHLIKVIKSKQNIDISTDRRAIQKLKREVEISKRALSSTYEYTIMIEDLVQDYDFSVVITRELFEELNSKLFNRILGPLQIALDASGLRKKKIDDIVLVGGSSRIPKVRQIIQEFFDGKEVFIGINPDEAICTGAAIRAGILCAQESKKNDGNTIIDASSLSQGSETADEVIIKTIPKVSQTLNKKSQILSTKIDKQQTNNHIDDEEIAMTEDNNSLSNIDLISIPSEKLEGILSNIHEFNSQEEEGIANNQIATIIDSDISKENIDQLSEDAEELAQQDKVANERNYAKNLLETYMQSMTDQIEDPEKLANKINDQDKDKIKEALKDIKKWLYKNSAADKEDYEEELKALEKVFEPIIRKHYGSRADYSKDQDL